MLLMRRKLFFSCLICAALLFVVIREADAQLGMAMQQIAEIGLRPNPVFFEIDNSKPNQAFEKFLKCGRYERAHEVIVKEYATAPSEASFSKLLASLLLIRRFDSVIEESEKYLSINPVVSVRLRARIYDSAGTAALHRQQFGASTIYFNKLLKLEPSSRSAIAGLAAIEARKLGTEPTEKSYTNSEKLLLMSLATTGVPLCEVRTDFKKTPVGVQKCLDAARSFENEGNFAAALNELSNGLKQYGDVSVLSEALALSKLSNAILSPPDERQQLMAQSLELFKSLIAKRPSDWRILNNLCAVSYLGEDTRDCASKLQELLRVKDLPDVRRDYAESALSHCSLLDRLKTDMQPRSQGP